MVIPIWWHKRESAAKKSFSKLRSFEGSNNIKLGRVGYTLQISKN